MENNQIKDLEVLKKYLSDAELKEVAREVAYDTFKNAIGRNNSNSKENLEFYIKHGAYQAVVQHAKENSLEDISELSKQLNTKVAKIISGLESYQIPYSDMIKEALSANKETVIRKVDSILEEVCSNDDSYDSVSHKVKESIGDWLGEKLMGYLKESFKSEE